MNLTGAASTNEAVTSRTSLILDSMERRAAARGLVLPRTREQSLRQFARLPGQVQDKFENYLTRFERLFLQQLDAADEFLEVSVKDELSCLEAVKQEYSLRFSRDIYDTLETGDVIEIYDADAIQIYRNLNFFKSTNYSLLDVISNPWMELWDRSSMIQGALERMVGRTMDQKFSSVDPCGVPEHILKEKAFGQSQALIARPKFVTKVTSERGEPFGFLFTVNIVQVIAEGDEADKIDFV